MNTLHTRQSCHRIRLGFWRLSPVASRYECLASRRIAWHTDSTARKRHLSQPLRFTMIIQNTSRFFSSTFTLNSSILALVPTPLFMRLPFRQINSNASSCIPPSYIACLTNTKWKISVGNSLLSATKAFRWPEYLLGNLSVSKWSKPSIVPVFSLGPSWDEMHTNSEISCHGAQVFSSWSWYVCSREAGQVWCLIEFADVWDGNHRPRLGRKRKMNDASSILSLLNYTFPHLCYGKDIWVAGEKRWINFLEIFEPCKLRLRLLKNWYFPLGPCI
jgi:hypothetical protein